MIGLVARVADRGYGFIHGAGGRVYFHANDMAPGAIFDALEVGDAVAFDVVTDGPKGPRAVNVRTVAARPTASRRGERTADPS
jgi:cold shock CspA family protein